MSTPRPIFVLAWSPSLAEHLQDVADGIVDIPVFASLEELRSHNDHQMGSASALPSRQSLEASITWMAPMVNRCDTMRLSVIGSEPHDSSQCRETETRQGFAP